MRFYRIAAVPQLDLDKDVSRSKREHKQQQRELQRYLKVVPGLVSKICQQGKTVYDEIKAAIPGRNTGTILRKRRRQWMKRVHEIEGLQEFCSHIAGEDSEKKVHRLICDISSGQMLLRDGKKRLTNWATNYFKSTETEAKRSDFSESGYDEQLLAFLPPQVHFDLGPNRELLAIKESFGREQKNWEIMSKKIAYIAQHYNEIVAEIKQDMASGDEATRILALMTAITIETGLRPGSVGNTANVIDPETGEKIAIDTFGVTTLQTQHISAIRDGFAELQFPGKKGTIQVAQLTDADIVNALQDIMNAAVNSGTSDMLFVTNTGEHIDDASMRQYVKEKWKDISPTDFRKYVATKTFYNGIKQAIDSFRYQLLDEITSGKEIIKDRIITGATNIINNAIESTKHVLSHKEGHEAWHSYISPKVILAFLSNGGLEDTLEEILIDNKNVRFSFDFKNFVHFANELVDETEKVA